MWSALLSLINSYQFQERMDTIWILVCIFSLFCYYWNVEGDGQTHGRRRWWRPRSENQRANQRISYVAWACKVGIQQMFFIFLLFFTLPALPHVISFSFFVWISPLPRGGDCVCMLRQWSEGAAKSGLLLTPLKPSSFSVGRPSVTRTCIPHSHTCTDLHTHLDIYTHTMKRKNGPTNQRTIAKSTKE